MVDDRQQHVEVVPAVRGDQTCQRCARASNDQLLGGLGHDPTGGLGAVAPSRVDMARIWKQIREHLLIPIGVGKAVSLTSSCSAGKTRARRDANPP